MTLVTLNIGLYLLSTLFLLCTLFKKGHNWCLQLSYLTLIAGILSQGTLLSYQIARGDFQQVSAIEALSVAVFVMLIIVVPYVRRHLNTAIGLTIFATIIQTFSQFNTFPLVKCAYFNINCRLCDFTNGIDSSTISLFAR